MHLVTGNTVIDALQFIAARVISEKEHWEKYFARQHGLALDGRRLILVTGHRRENFGAGFKDICLALRQIVETYPQVHLVYPVHLNPQVQNPVYEILSGSETAREENGGALHLENPGGGCLSLLPPLDYAPFVYLMSRSYLVITDSGGIQEEAPALGKPVLVMREVTERPEGVWGGTVKLVGTSQEPILAEVKELLENPDHYQAMAQAKNPYGDGRASLRIVEILGQQLRAR